jgi:hypothetical protein
MSFVWGRERIDCSRKVGIARGKDMVYGFQFDWSLVGIFRLLLASLVEL